MQKQNSFKHIIYITCSLLIAFYSCEKESADVSDVVYYPEFEFIGGQEMYLVINDTAVFSDPGLIVTENGKPIPYQSEGADQVWLDSIGEYLIKYVAVNSWGYADSAIRYVNVVCENDKFFEMRVSDSAISENEKYLPNVTKINPFTWEIDDITLLYLTKISATIDIKCGQVFSSEAIYGFETDMSIASDTLFINWKFRTKEGTTKVPVEISY